MLVSISVPVPFVHTSKKLLPMSFTNCQTFSKAVFMLTIVFCPSAAHASLNGSKIFAKMLLNFSTQGIVVASKTEVSIEGCTRTGADDSASPESPLSVSLFNFSILSKPAIVLLNFSAAFVADFVDVP